MMKVNFAYDLLPSLDGAICTVTETLEETSRQSFSQGPLTIHQGWTVPPSGGLSRPP